MHASSFENMQKCYSRYVAGGLSDSSESMRVLDVGGADINGSYRQIFCHPRFSYTAADISPGPGVQVVFDDPYRMPFDDRSMDVVISGQMLEHCEFFWLAFSEMVRVTKPGGYIFLIAPSAGPEHRFPVDCYRFYPDAYRALARYANCALVDVWQDPRGPWKDLVGVFQRHGPPPSAPRLVEKLAVAPEAIAPGSDTEERVQGQAEYLQVLGDLHASLSPRCYLEIGVRHGRSLALARCPAIGVDPGPALQSDLPESTRIFRQTSDDFFELSVHAALPAPVDFAFIDGLHLFEVALRDFMNIERVVAPGALIAIDDVLPNHPVQAERERRTRVWTGDVWKLVLILRRHRPDLEMVLLDTAPSGCLLIGGLDPANQLLWDAYNPIVREAQGWGTVPVEVLERRGAISPLSPAYATFIAALTEARHAPHSRIEAMRALVSSDNFGVHS